MALDKPRSRPLARVFLSLQHSPPGTRIIITGTTRNEPYIAHGTTRHTNSAIARSRVRERGQTPVGERQVASVAALPISSRFADRFAAIER